MLLETGVVGCVVVAAPLYRLADLVGVVGRTVELVVVVDRFALMELVDVVEKILCVLGVVEASTADVVVTLAGVVEICSNMLRVTGAVELTSVVGDDDAEATAFIKLNPEAF